MGGFVKFNEYQKKDGQYSKNGYNNLMETQTIRKLKFKDGSEYQGTTVDGVPHGKGKMTYPDGKLEEGNWKDGEFLYE